MSHLLYPKSYIWKQFLLSRLGFKPNGLVWVSAHSVQNPLHPSEVFISASHLLPALFSMSGSSGLAATCSLPSALVSSLHKQINLPHFYPVTSFTEEQRNENKWQFITHIHSGTTAVLCCSQKTSMQARELHDNNWENHSGTYITVCIQCYSVCSVQGSKGVTFQWTNVVSK